MNPTKSVEPTSTLELASFYEGKKVLITGGLGFIGSTLAHRLVEYKADVLLVDSLISSYGGNYFNIHGIEDKVQVNISDVRDQYSMNHLVQGVDLLFNMAGTLSHIDSMTNPFEDLEINCRSQLSILEACRQYNPGLKIVFAGTRGQYGKAHYMPVDEGHPMIPTDVNGINNIAGEAYHLLYNNVYEIRATSLRLTNTYGPRHQMKHHKQGITNWFIRQVMDGTIVKIYGDGTQVRDLNYVDDVVDALLLAMADDRADGQVYNLGGEPVNIKEMVEMMIEIHGKGEYELVPFPEESLKIEIGDYVADWSKIQTTLGWGLRVNFREGLARTFEYYVQNKEHYW